ncbi:MAG: hypothetical protein HYZ58_05510 [Acidobacteria bacterium]|nr:hypothetical protein [Acidobacteriota bacterium]
MSRPSSASLAGGGLVLASLILSGIHPHDRLTWILGTQGDPWDTQSDMALALVGATVALFALSHAPDRQMSALDGFHDDVAGVPDPNP